MMILSLCLSIMLLIMALCRKGFGVMSWVDITISALNFATFLHIIFP